MEFIFATNNPGKVKEVNALLADSGHTVCSLSDIAFAYEAIEDGQTFTENAVKKAKGCAEALRERRASHPSAAVLADDSGLVIDALDGKPGVYSARFLGEDTPYEEKNRQILSLLSETPKDKRTARFVCVIACVLPDGRVFTAEETVEGAIAYAPQGENGFGYDPIFFLPDREKTMAALSQEEKNQISHRGKALHAMKRLLEQVTAP